MYYYIQPVCGNKTDSLDARVLSIDNNAPTGTLIINTKSSSDDSQLWQPIAYTLNGVYSGIVLLNKKTGLVAAAPKDGHGDVTGCNLSEISEKKATWNIIGTAIQLTGNTALNLNVSGDGPYPAGTKVIAWNWSKGQPNETWNFIAADF